MRLKKIFFRVLILCTAFFLQWGFLAGQGYYKDLLINGGIYLSCYGQTEAQNLGLSYEKYCDWDPQMQSQFFGGHFGDLNGALLYPDGEPRFRLIFNNGGYGDHGGSLSGAARDAVAKFYENGGSYTGSCNGAFLASCKVDAFRLYCGDIRGTGLGSDSTGFLVTHLVPPTSPLRNYYNFATEVPDVFHSGGYYVPETNNALPLGAEVLLRYKGGSTSWPYPGDWWNLQGLAAAWAYKTSAQSGRVAVSGSHPEAGGNDPAIRKLQEAMYQYALDGNGDPSLKKALSNGQTWYVDQATNPNYYDRDRIKIGDKQYHHFTVQVGVGQSRLSIDLQGEPNYALNLYARPGNDFVFDTNATYFATQAQNTGSSQTLCINNPQAGIWHISVECATTVSVDNQTWGYPLYSGQTAVLNGVAYNITATSGAAGSLSISGLASSYDVNDPAVSLTGIPAGGTFSGPGVLNGQFVPSVAGTGTHQVVYTLGCDQTSRTVSVTDFCSGSAPGLSYPEPAYYSPGLGYNIYAVDQNPSIQSYTWSVSSPFFIQRYFYDAQGRAIGIKIRYWCNSNVEKKGSFSVTAHYCGGNSYTSTAMVELGGCSSNPYEKQAGAEGAFDFRISPNPASDFVRFSSSEVGIVEIYDIRGQILIQQRLVVGEESQLDLQAWSPGLYLYRYRKEGGQILKNGKLIVQ